MVLLLGWIFCFRRLICLCGKLAAPDLFPNLFSDRCSLAACPLPPVTSAGLSG
jgi:hypothetical protein